VVNNEVDWIGVNVMSRVAVVVNTTKGTMLASSAKLATTYGERRQGLLGRSSLEEGEGLIIRPCKGVHSFGMKFSIDVAYASKDGEILHIISPLHPNRFGPLMLRAAWILELPQGILTKLQFSRVFDRYYAFIRRNERREHVEGCSLSGACPS
jgi:uncharacterized membrane protein (UPF0127 family)